MKTIGLLGGMSWESTALYYQQINKMVHRKLGKLHSAKVIINSVDFEEIAALQAKGLWQEAGTYLAEQAQNLEKQGQIVFWCALTPCIKLLSRLKIQFRFLSYTLLMQRQKKF